MNDIFTQANIETALRESKEYFVAALEAADVGMWIRRSDGEWVMNRQVNVFFGHSPDSLPMTEHEFISQIHPNDFKRIKDSYLAAIEYCQAFEEEYRVAWPDGSIHWLVSKGKPFYLDGLHYFMGSTYDISERKKAEEELLKRQQREKLFSTVASRLLASENPQDIIGDLCQKTMRHLTCDVFFNYLVDQERECLHLNAFAGIPRDEALKIEWLEHGVVECGYAAKEGRRIVVEKIACPHDPRADFVKTYGVRAYACTPLIVGGHLIGALSFGTRSRASFTEDELAVMHTVADHIAIAMSRLLTIQQLRKNEKRLEELVMIRTREKEEVNRQKIEVLESISDCFISLDYELRYININRAAEEWGISKELIGLKVTEVFPQFNSYTLKKFRQVLQERSPQYYETHSDAFSSWVGVSVYPAKNGISVYFQDITERKEAEEALRQCGELFFRAFHGNPMMMALLTFEEGLFVDVNKAFCTGAGFIREEIIGLTTDKINCYPNIATIQNLKQILLGEGKLENIEVDLAIKSGEIRTYLLWSQLFYLKEKPYHIATLTDITNQKRIEDELARLERLNLIGEMAAAIGHEIRNPMTSIRGFLQLLSSKDEYKNDQVYFDLMMEELDRANGIISEYLSMAKNKKVELHLQSLDTIISSLEPIIRSDANQREINLQLELSNPPKVCIDENEIRQLILNMTRNGLEAMSSRGTLTIGTLTVVDHAALFIKDEGPGLDSSLLDRLGTPFLTTKDRGTGLGLAVCYSIATRHHARIDYETGPAGTTFYIHFPLPVPQGFLF